MHPLNRYKTRPDFAVLASKYPELKPFVSIDSSGYGTIDFQNAAGLRALTAALLREDFGLDINLRDDRLCPTIANRLDYLLMLLDLEPYCDGTIALLDVGTGAYAIYCLLMRSLRPECRLIATEIDEESLRHAQAVAKQNKVEIELVKTTAMDPILKPLYDGATVSFSLCNPPFFASKDEMQAGSDLKALIAPAGPTAADNELITPGGEVAFVSQMMLESLDVKERCQWFTTLLGKLSSVAPLVEFLRSRQIHNYFVRASQQSRTVRWVLGWSFSDIRLPDALTRPPGGSLLRYAPPTTEFTFVPKTEMDLKQAVEEILGEARIPYVDGVISPCAVSWTRQARRKASHNAPNETETGKAIFRAKIEITPTSLTLRWTRGKDRASVESLWVFIVRRLRMKNV